MSFSVIAFLCVLCVSARKLIFRFFHHLFQRYLLLLCDPSAVLILRSYRQYFIARLLIFILILP